MIGDHFPVDDAGEVVLNHQVVITAPTTVAELGVALATALAAGMPDSAAVKPQAHPHAAIVCRWTTKRRPKP